MNIKEILTNLLNEKGVSTDTITEDSSLKSLGLDSLDTAEIMMDIEDKLNIEFATDELRNLETIKDVLNLIENKIQ